MSSHPDVIVVNSTPGIRAALKASATIPIVFANAGDAAGASLLASLARHAGNVTGSSFIAADGVIRRFDLLR